MANIQCCRHRGIIASHNNNLAAVRLYAAPRSPPGLSIWPWTRLMIFAFYEHDAISQLAFGRLLNSHPARYATGDKWWNQTTFSAIRLRWFVNVNRLVYFQYTNLLYTRGGGGRRPYSTAQITTPLRVVREKNAAIQRRRRSLLFAVCHTISGNFFFVCLKWQSSDGNAKNNIQLNMNLCCLCCRFEKKCV